MAKKIILKDRQGNQLLPITKGDFVETASGKTLLTTLSEMQHELDGKQEALTAGSYITIDGSYVIDVNVTHEYSAYSYLPISSYGVAAHLDEIEAATAAALTTLHHENGVILGYVDSIKATYATKSYVEDYAENEILPLIPIVDNRILSSSENPVQNKVIYEALEDVRVTVDTALDASSYNPVANKAITYVITENEQVVSEALHGLDTRVTYLEENGGGGSGNSGSVETSLCYYDASWLCGYAMNDVVSDDLIAEIISYNNSGTPILIDGHSCDVDYSVVQGGINGGEINASSYMLWVSYTRTLSNTYTTNYLGYGVGDGSLALNTTYLKKTQSATLSTHFHIEYSIDTEISPSSLIQEMYGGFDYTDGVLYSYNTRITALETAYAYFSDIDDELSETSYKAVTNATITYEFNTLADVTATALTDHNNRIIDLETAYSAMNDYATKSYVTERIAEIPAPDMSAYVSKEYLSQQSYLQASALNGYVTNTSLATTLSSYAKTSDLADNEAVIAAFLTQWQSYVDSLLSRVAELEDAVEALQQA